MSGAAGDGLIRALARAFGALSNVEAQSCPWSSATFSGTRHMLWITVRSTSDTARIVAELPEIDLPIPGHFVADIEIAERHDRGDTLRLGIRALTIAEA